jgi:O-antigen ligase
MNLVDASDTSASAGNWTGTLVVVVLATVVAISSTTGLGVGSSWFDEQRSLLLLILATLAFCTLLRTQSESVSLALCATLILGLVSSLFAIRTYLALIDWAVYSLMSLLIATAYPRSSAHDLRLAASLAVLIVATAYSTGVVSNYVSSLLLGFPVGGETLLVGFSNPRFPAQLQALTIPFLPLAMRVAPRGFWRSALCVVASLWWMCLIGSGSRTAWISLAAAGLLMLIFGRAGRHWLFTQCLFFLAGLALWLAFFYGVPSLIGIASQLESGRLTSFGSAVPRWALWLLSLESVRAHPLLGVGPMHFAYTYNPIAAHPHNFWLQLAGEWGLPAAILAACTVLAFCVRLARAARSCADADQQEVGTTLVAATAAWGVGTLADGNMVIPTSQAMSVVVLMLATTWLRGRSPAVGAPDTVARMTGRVFQLLATVAIVAIASLPFTRFGDPTGREAAWRAENLGTLLLPRFWQQGWIGPDHDITARP